MAKKKPRIVGRWRITSMTEWDQDFVEWAGELDAGKINVV